MRHIFTARLQFGGPSLSKFVVEKETLKLFKLGSETLILGSKSYASQIHKDDMTCFENPVDAVAYLIAEQSEYIERTQERLKEASDSLVTLKSLLKELEK